MADEHKLQSDAVRGARADELLQNELLKEAFQTLEREYTDSWVKSQPHEREAREFYWKALQVLADVQAKIQIVARNGRVAKTELEMLAKQIQPKR
jgi:protein involved in temperature-dependent protein secretion